MKHEMAVAAEIARKAGDVLVRHFRDADLEIQAKGERDVVTPADFESEEFIVRRLTEEFPEDGIVAEEGGERKEARRRTWYVDPLDGTLNFSRGVPVFCVSLALFERDAGLIGIIHDPIRGETFMAAVGHGAFLGGQSTRTTGLSHLERAVVHITVDFNDASQQEGLEDIRRIAPAVLRTRNLGSAALSLAYVAAGRLDAVLHRHANAWDYGAGVVLIEQAGGSVSAMTGKPWRPGEESIAAAASLELRTALTGVVNAP